MSEKHIKRRSMITTAGATRLGMLAGGPAAAGVGQEGVRPPPRRPSRPPSPRSARRPASGRRPALRGAASPEPELSGTGFTYRHNWGPRRGQWTLGSTGDVNPRSHVFVSIGEGAAGGPDAGKFIGAARYTLHNVAPRAGGVDIWVNIEWSSDILLYVDYLVVNPTGGAKGRSR